MRQTLLSLCLWWVVKAANADGIPFEILFPCAVSPPPISSEYLKASEKERESLLVVYIQQLLTDIGECDDKVTAFREWYFDTFTPTKGLEK